MGEGKEKGASGGGLLHGMVEGEWGVGAAGGRGTLME